MADFEEIRQKIVKNSALKMNSLGGQRWFENPLGGLTTSSPRVLAPMSPTIVTRIYCIFCVQLHTYKTNLILKYMVVQKITVKKKKYTIYTYW